MGEVSIDGELFPPADFLELVAEGFSESVDDSNVLGFRCRTRILSVGCK